MKTLHSRGEGNAFGREILAWVEKRKINESLKGTKAGLYFRGDCYIQGWMRGEVPKEFGTTSEEAWKNTRKKKRLRIQ